MSVKGYVELGRGSGTSQLMPGARGLHVLLSILILAASVVGRGRLLDVPLVTLCNLASACVLLTLIAAVLVFPDGPWSASFVYLAVFSVFHFGLTFVVGLGASLAEETELYLSQWFYTYYTFDAIFSAVIGLLACSIGMSAASFFAQRDTRKENLDGAGVDDVEYPFPSVGFLFVLFSIFSWLVIVIASGGPGLLTASYGELLSATAGRGLSWTYYGMGIGIAFLASGGPSRLRKAGLLAFAGWSMIALPLGLRGEVLFPTLTGLVVIAKRKAPFSPLMGVVLAIMLLSAIAFIRELRQVGLRDVAMSEIGASPINALAEMGGSLRPVTEVIRWEQEGDVFIYGASYWAPFDRALRRVIPIGDRPAAQDDDRIMNVLVQRRVGPIGFSPIAEAYRNFGNVGVVVIMFLTGILLGWMDSWPSAARFQVALGVVFVTLLIQVRNDFIPVPSQIMLGLFILHGTMYLRQILDSRKY